MFISLYNIYTHMYYVKMDIGKYYTHTYIYIYWTYIHRRSIFDALNEFQKSIENQIKNQSRIVLKINRKNGKI